jgi:hypothetical protein
VAAHKLDAISGAIEYFGEQLNESLVGGRIDRWRCNFHPQLIAQRFADLIGSRPGLEFD